MSGSATPETDKPEAGFYVAGVMDILGHSDHLRAMNSLPSGHKECQEITERILSLARQIDSFRKGFRDLFVRKRQEQFDGNAELRGLSEPDRQVIQDCLSVEPQIEHFMDMVVIRAPLSNSRDTLTGLGLYSMLVASAGMMIQQLSLGIPFVTVHGVEPVRRGWAPGRVS